MSTDTHFTHKAWHDASDTIKKIHFPMVGDPTGVILLHARPDGTSTIEQLILRDPRAVCMARHHLRILGARAEDIPPRGERVRLVELGTHCRGAVFLDGSWVLTPALEEAIAESRARMLYQIEKLAETFLANTVFPDFVAPVTATSLQRLSAAAASRPSKLCPERET